MQAFHFDTDYTFLLNEKEARKLGNSKLECDLQDRDSHEKTGKEIGLSVGNPEFSSEAELKTDKDTWDKSSRIDIVLAKHPYNLLMQKGNVTCRLSYDNVFVIVDYVD